jgi:dsDNA-specific endonuclease/ATPase MutS2
VTDAPDPTEPIVLPISDELDLHHFRPREVGPLVRDYLEECAQLGIARVRLIHGKGIGNLRRTVHAELERHPRVADFELAGHARGSWGATIAHLRIDPKPDEP